jgi:hypothetical protein
MFLPQSGRPSGSIPLLPHEAKSSKVKVNLFLCFLFTAHHAMKAY